MKIETGIPIPCKKSAQSARRLRYPVDKLQVGDCITCDDYAQYLKVQHSACTYWDKTKEFTCRKKHLRIWRTK